MKTDIIWMLVGLDLLFMFTGMPSVTGWICDRLGI